MKKFGDSRDTLLCLAAVIILLTTACDERKEEIVVTPVHVIGENFGGGIIFYTYDNGQHGLIVAKKDQSTGLQWYNGVYKNTGATGERMGSGPSNTAVIISAQVADSPTGNFAAKACDDYVFTEGGYTYNDWFLPSRDELNILYLHRNKVAGVDDNIYWSSTESSDQYASLQSFLDGQQNFSLKIYPNHVRAIRSF